MKAWKWMFPLLLTPQFMIAAAVSIYATTPGAAQTITNGGLTGVMVTRAAKVGASTTITFLTVPANRYFILTQACYTTAAGTNLRLNGVGGAQGNQGNTSAEPEATLDNTDCKQFTPGLVYQPGDAVAFRNNGASLQRVYINGVLINKGGRILPPLGGILESPNTPTR
ncbi:MAG TPA: hypothetical protein VGQ63_23205 [Pseudolabrys sp.]|nr:hypothetical protein [Pseudolabrys sp.]